MNPLHSLILYFGKIGYNIVLVSTSKVIILHIHAKFCSYYLFLGYCLQATFISILPLLLSRDQIFASHTQCLFCHYCFHTVLQIWFQDKILKRFLRAHRDYRSFISLCLQFIFSYQSPNVMLYAHISYFPDRHTRSIPEVARQVSSRFYVYVLLLMSYAAAKMTGNRHPL
jgi:hypothetical protein